MVDQVDFSGQSADIVKELVTGIRPFEPIVKIDYTDIISCTAVQGLYFDHVIKLSSGYCEIGYAPRVQGDVDFIQHTDIIVIIEIPSKGG